MHFQPTNRNCEKNTRSQYKSTAKQNSMKYPMNYIIVVPFHRWSLFYPFHLNMIRIELCLVFPRYPHLIPVQNFVYHSRNLVQPSSKTNDDVIKDCFSGCSKNYSDIEENTYHKMNHTSASSGTLSIVSSKLLSSGPSLFTFSSSLLKSRFDCDST